jgi:hypothetical protein
MPIVIKLISFLFIAVFFWSCATQGQLTGGDPDEDPPKIIQEGSSPNFQTNHKPEKFELEFDEFIQIKNAIKEVGVSPPLTGIPKVTAKGKKLIFEFPENEVLKDDVTYTVNFGSAIADYHESNVLENYKYVFATGDKLDSLSIKGRITDAFTGEGVEEALVMLYDNLADTAVYTERPLYYAKTSESGFFDISNLKQDTFAIYAILDDNLSYTWDQKTESIAFIDSSFVLVDSVDFDFSLSMSLPSSEPEVIDHSASANGKIKVALTTESDSIPAFEFSTEVEYYSELEKDSLFIWYDTTGVYRPDLYLLNDTLSIKPKKKKSKSAFTLELETRKSTASVLPGDSLLLSFDYPIINIIKDSISISDTSGQSVLYSLTQGTDLTKLYFIIIDEPILEENYGLIAKDSSLVSYNTIYNDSLGFNFNYLNKENLGTLHLSFDSVSLEKDYILELMDDEEVIETISFNASYDKHSFYNLLPKAYSIRLIDDANGDGKWTPGNYLDKTPPEWIKARQLDKIKENWELEMDLSNMINNLESDDTKGG